MLLAAAFLPAATQAQVPVDVELVIAADVSLSMDPEETRLQQQGFVEAFRHPDIVETIQNGPTGRIAVIYLEWGGARRHRVAVPWTLIDGPASARSFARHLETNRPASLKRGTSIGSALLASRELLRDSGFSGARRIVNISGDGASNSGPDLGRIRRELLADGITINGLPIVYKGLLEGVITGAASNPDPQSLIDYFERNVIGGPYAFVKPVTTIGSYTESIRRKLLREIGAPVFAGLQEAPAAPLSAGLRP